MKAPQQRYKERCYCHCFTDEEMTRTSGQPDFSEGPTNGGRGQPSTRLLLFCNYNTHLKPRLTWHQGSCTPWLSLYLPGHFFSIFFAGFPSSSQPLNTSRLRPQASLLSYLHSPSGRSHRDLLVIPTLTSLVQISPPTNLLTISNVRHPKLSSYYSALNLVLFTDVLTSVNGKSILLVARNRNPESVFDSPLSLLSYMSNPSGGINENL